MQHTKKSTIGAALIGLVGAGTFIASQTASAADGIKAAYVETVIPSKSYTGQLSVSVYGTTATTGPSQPGVLGISSIVLTNTDTQVQGVIVGVPYLGSAACGTTYITAYFSTFYFYVQPQSTLVVPFPTPYVINPAGGQACIAIDASGFVSVGGGIQALVTGLLN